MKLKNSVLSDSEKERIHQHSLTILKEVGVCFKSRKALRILEQAGAPVDYEKERAIIPPEMVDEALRRAPKEFLLGARNPDYDFPMPSGRTGLVLDGTCPDIVDFETGEKRPGRRRDVFEANRVFHQMDLGVMAWAACVANDMPKWSHCIHETFAMMRGTSKHVQFELFHEADADYVLEGLAAMMGSEDALRKKAVASAVYCTVSPLLHDGGMCDAYLKTAEYGLPVMPYPMPLPGFTSPASLFSTVCMKNAEVLSTVVLFEFAHPGTPIIYGSAEGLANFSTGEYVEKAESNLMSLAGSEMAEFYGLPSCSQGGGSSVADNLPLFCSAVDLVEGIGTREGAKTLILDEIVLGNEAAHIAKRYADGINSELDFIDDILAVEPGGNFLKQKTTRKMIRDREEFYSSRVLPVEIIGKLDERERMTANAREVVREILEGPVPDPLPEKVLQTLDTIAARADRELKDLKED